MRGRRGWLEAGWLEALRDLKRELLEGSEAHGRSRLMGPLVGERGVLQVREASRSEEAP